MVTIATLLSFSSSATTVTDTVRSSAILILLLMYYQHSRGEPHDSIGVPQPHSATSTLAEMVNIQPLAGGKAEMDAVESPVKKKQPKLKMYNTRHKQRDLDRKK